MKIFCGFLINFKVFSINSGVFWRRLEGFVGTFRLDLEMGKSRDLVLDSSLDLFFKSSFFSVSPDFCLISHKKSAKTNTVGLIPNPEI